MQFSASRFFCVVCVVAARDRLRESVPFVINLVSVDLVN